MILGFQRTGLILVNVTDVASLVLTVSELRMYARRSLILWHSRDERQRSASQVMSSGSVEPACKIKIVLVEGTFGS